MNHETFHFRVLCIFGLLTAFLLVGSPAFAQTASVTGRVLDQAGAVVPGVTVTLTSETGAERTSVSSDVGVFQFQQVPPGTYTLKAELTGFKTALMSGVQLLVDTPRVVDLKLEIGQLSETVTVEAGALKLNTTDATIGNAFEAKRIVELPLEDRNVANLLSLQAAVTKDGYVSGSRADQSNLTLDGIDVNEQQEGTAFETVLRVNPDSVQEFRVTTTTPTATQGRSSGGQVSLVTKTGTNEWHGSVYEYHRNTATTANNFFNNRSPDPELNSKPPKLLRNLFGASFSGPVKKDRIFFFYNYEGRRDAKAESVDPSDRPVPLASLGQGLVKYTNTSGGITTLTPADILSLYPGVNGVNPVAVAALAEAAKKYPANDFSYGDGLNYAGYRFNAPLPVNYNAHTATLSFNLDTQARHIVTLRGNYQHDKEAGAPQFPDTPGTDRWSHPYGFGANYTWTLNPTLVNTFRIGLTRQAYSQQGDSAENSIGFRFVYWPRDFSRTLSRVTPVWNIVDDISWVNGNHTWQFGTNIRLIDNKRVSYSSSYDDAVTNPSFYENSGAVLNEPIDNLAGNVAGFQAALTAVIGRYSQYSGNYNFNADGSPQAQGEGVLRNFATEEYEFYAQDTWRARNDLTLTLGLRYSLNTPVYESNGLEVKPTPGLSEIFAKRKAWAAGGIPYNELFAVDLAGPANNRPGFYKLDKNNFAPRAAFAWTPSFENGLLKAIFGTGQKSVFRGGFASSYDRVGSRLAVSFDLNNALGFSSSQTIAANTFNVTDKPAPLFTGFNQDIRKLPLIKVPSKLAFPLEFPADEDQRIESSLDDSITTPVNYSWNFSIAREIGKGTTLEFSYIGRSASNLLLQRDMMALNNLVDPKSGVDWYTAMGTLIDLRAKDTPITSIQKIPYFENMFPLLPEWVEDTSLTATQSAYMAMARESVGGWNIADYTYLQLLWDDGLGYGDNLFFQPQVAALAAWSTVGYSDYHAGTVSLRQRFSSFNLDFNYTFSKSTDNASGLQNTASFGGDSGGGWLINSLKPDDNHALSDFDITHLVNANILWELPFGKGRSYLNSLHPAANAILGGWQMTGVFRWNSGLPLQPPFDAQMWATNWNTQSFGVRTKSFEASPTKSGNEPNLFADPKAAYQSFRNAKAGESGNRNIFRQSEYFALDFGLQKSFAMPWSEGHRIQFRWEVFNATNSQFLAGPVYSRSGMGLQIDPNLSDPAPDFGVINSIQGSPRVMQFALRYDF